MPQRIPWPNNYFVGFPGRSPYGDVLLSFAKYRKENQIPGYLEREAAMSEWWAKHPGLLNVLVNTAEVRTQTFWDKTFADCETYFKTSKPLEKGTVIVEHRLESIRGLYFGCVHMRHSEEAIQAVQDALNRDAPVLFDERWESRDMCTKLFLFGPYLWKVTQEELAAEPEHFRLLFLEAMDKDRLRFERLKNKFSGLAGAKLERSREPIPEKVRIFVWRRDGGKCVRCGSNERLEFDHIIPLTEGGSNTERNLQLLCEPCNRAKSATI